MCLQIWEHSVPTLDFPLVGGLKLGLPNLHLPHCLLDNDSRPMLGLLGPKKKEWQVTKGSSLLRTLPWKVITRLSLVTSWWPPNLQVGLIRVINVGKG